MRSNEQPVNSPEHYTVEELTLHLIASGINVASWGTDGAKTVSHLHKEIAEGESQVDFSVEGNASRQVRAALVDVLFFDAYGNVYQLYEAQQEYKDGRVRRRQLNSSLGEKFKPDEQPAEAATRALVEELGIMGYQSLHAIGHEQTTHTPDSYPGLKSQYDTYSFVIVLDESSYNPQGYIEVQDDKTNYYAWKLIRPAGLSMEV